MGELRIGTPRIARMNDGSVRISSVISLPDSSTRDLWFRTDAANAEYIVHERADAFLVGLIPFIARNGGKVVCDAPVSGHLLHNLHHLLSPVLPAFHPDFSQLEISAESDETNLRALGADSVGTGCSCGIDSMATLATYTRSDTPTSLKVDTLTFFDVGSHGLTGCENGNSKASALAKGRYDNVLAFAHAISLPVVSLDSNISDFNAGLSHIHLHTFRNMSAVLALQKRFAAYHYASGFPITHFRITLDGLSHADEFLLRCLSTESTRLHSSLAALTRQQRTSIVAGYEPARRFLNVCVRNVENCGFCFKCARTMFQLDLIGRLNAFKDVFNIGDYRKNRRRILKLIAKDTHFHDEYLAAASRANSCPYSKATLRIAFASGKISHLLVRARKRLAGKTEAV